MGTVGNMSIYDQIANFPKGINPVGAYAQGQKIGQQNRLGELQLQAQEMSLQAMPEQNRLANMLTQAQIMKAMQSGQNLPTYGKSVAAWGTDENGNPVPLLTNDRGEMVVPEKPEGITGYQEPMKMLDFGGFYQGYGSRSGQPRTDPLEKGIPPEDDPQNILDKEAALDRAERIKTSRKQIATMSSMNSKYDEAIRLSQNGANTGPIDRLLPTFNAQTAALEHLQKEMGLDVVGAVTFGALSKSEMDIAMQTALPTNMNGPQLVAWLQRKKIANQKLAKYLHEQISYLQKGNNIEDWLEYKSKKSGGNSGGQVPPGVAPELWEVMTPEERKAFQ